MNGASGAWVVGECAGKAEAPSPRGLRLSAEGGQGDGALSGVPGTAVS